MRSIGDKFIYLVWTDGECWNSVLLGKVKPYESKKVSYSDVAKYIPSNAMPALAITEQTIPDRFNEISAGNSLGSSWPMWRATLGLDYSNATASYQGELMPFRKNGSLLSFFPFFPHEEGGKSFLILINIESSPVIRDATLEVHTLSNKEKVVCQSITNNNVSVVDLSALKISQEEIVVCSSKNVSAIPLLLSIDRHGKLLGLEHTHPPASYSILGDRFGIQATLKKTWFKQLK